MKTTWTWVVVFAALAAAGCKKTSKDSHGAAPAASPAPAAPAAPTPNPAPDTAPVAGDALADEQPAEEPPDPIEKGLDDAWMNDTEGCKPNQTAADLEFKKQYEALCATALTRVVACVNDPKFLDAQEIHAADQPDEARALRKQFRAKGVKDLCKTLAGDQLCLYQGRSFSNSYSAGELRKMTLVPAGDCFALGKVFPGELMETGE